jgi:tetratricopeptide (TPR) repeat protein
MMKIVEDKKLHLPPEIQDRCRYHEELALRSIQGKDYSSAEQAYKNLLSEIIEAQRNVTRYHKGVPYHQIGYCLLLQGNNDAALTYFQYAFVEDCITSDTFPSWSAFKNLYGIYKTAHEDLLALFDEIKRDIQVTVPLIGEEYLRRYLDSGKKIESVSVRREIKVFVGGNYRNIAVLRHIEGIVRKSGLSPILASNFKAGESEAYLHAMHLLEDCGSAVFEVTFDAGHLMEIERAIRLIDNKNILLLYQKTEQNDKQYTRMLWDMEVEQVGYMGIDELEDKLKSFLSGIKH